MAETQDISVNYIPVRVEDLPRLSSLNGTDSLLMTRPDSEDQESMAYHTAKLPYDNLSSQLYRDVSAFLTSQLGVSVLTSNSDLDKQTSALFPSNVFGSRVTQHIYNLVKDLSAGYVKISRDEQISGKKTFTYAPTVICSDAENPEVSSLATVGYVNERTS